MAVRSAKKATTKKRAAAPGKVVQAKPRVATKAATQAQPAVRKKAATQARPTARRKAAEAARTKAPPTEEARSVSQGVLLSGGNPQIPKGDGDAPVQAYLAAMPGWKRDAGARLDALVVQNVPGVKKAVRWNSPFYGVEGQGWFLSFHCFTKYIKVTFLRGTSLRPLPPVGSKDPNTRYFHIYESDSIDEQLLSSWVRQASDQPGDPLF